MQAGNGVDLVLMPENLPEAAEGVLDAVEDGTHSYVAEVPAKALASYRWQK